MSYDAPASGMPGSQPAELASELSEDPSEEVLAPAAGPLLSFGEAELHANKKTLTTKQVHGTRRMP